MAQHGSPDPGDGETAPTSGEAADQPPEKIVAYEASLLQGGFTMVPNLVLLNPELEAGARVVYALLSHYARQTDACWPGQERLADNLGLSERTIRKHIRALEAAKLLETKRRGLRLTNVYVLKNPPAEYVDRMQVMLSDRQPGSGQDSGSATVAGPGTGSQLPTKKKEDAVRNNTSGQGPEVVSLEEKRATCWRHYLSLADRHEVKLRSRELTPSRARLLDKGLKEGSMDECVAAITGLFASEWYRERGYSDLAYVFNTRPGGKTLREQMDRFIDYAESAGQGLSITSADPDTINRAKRAVLAGYDLAGNADSRATAERAEAWLASVGIEVDRSGERPTFKKKGSA